LPATYLSRISTLLQFDPTQNSQVTDPSLVGRTSENMVAWQMFLDHPVLGVGLGNFKENYQAYSRDLGLDQRRTVRSPASLYLELLSEQGILGTVIFLFLLGLIFREMFSARTNFQLSGLPNESFMVIALIASFAGYLFLALFKNSAYSNAFWVIVGIALAAGQVAHTSRQQAFEASVREPGTELNE
jgi:O-antigen ligase